MKIDYYCLIKMRRQHPYMYLTRECDSQSKCARFSSENEGHNALSFILNRILPVSFFAILFILISQSSAYGQNVTLKKNNVALETILKEIETQTSYVFL
ncbi:hypothetical protein [Pedobacter sp. P26]|uniref:hypothetical protein n=1 Tax=Pedobacter sp. P26 TaxID=3423956 RepID=UPI003D67A548